MLKSKFLRYGGTASFQLPAPTPKTGLSCQISSEAFHTFSLNWLFEASGSKILLKRSPTEKLEVDCLLARKTTPETPTKRMAIMEYIRSLRGKLNCLIFVIRINTITKPANKNPTHTARVLSSKIITRVSEITAPNKILLLPLFFQNPQAKNGRNINKADE